MRGYAAHRLGVQITCLDPGGAASPAGQAGARVVKGSFRDAAKIKELSECVDPGHVRLGWWHVHFH